ncbi:MAG: hypothetical protein FWD13_00895 [Treponema sp.]|nr:hypothetical protein [Treponema sp.]
MFPGRFFIFTFLLIFFLGSCLTSDNYQNRDWQKINEIKNIDDKNGSVRLVLNERTGSFSLYFLSDPSRSRYEALFNTEEVRASYLSVNVNGRVNRLGDRRYRSRFERIDGNPALVFESRDLIVSQVFSPVKTSNSQVANGIMINVTIQNKSDQALMVGLRMLIDTELGEGRGRVPFITSNQVISNETLIEGSSGSNFWISRGQNTSLMGSITNPLNPNAYKPDYIYFANWKRLNDSKWKPRYSERRSFNNDSAVCYIYEPAELHAEGSFVYTIFLTTEDAGWYNTNNQQFIAAENIFPPNAVIITQTPASNPPFSLNVNIARIEQEAYYEAEQYNDNAYTLTLMKLQDLLNQFIAGEILLNEQDLLEIESAINRYR